MHIKALKIEHSGQFKKLFDECFSQLKVPYANTIHHDFILKRVFQSSIYSTDCSKAIFSSSRELCGFCIANLSLNPLQKNWEKLYLNLFFIKPDFRNSGFGRELINNLILTAKDSNKKSIITSLQWSGIWPGIFVNWKDSIKFCKKTGGEIKSGEIFLEIDLLDIPVDKYIKNTADNSILIRPYHNDDFQNLKKIAGQFGTGWLHEILNKVSHQYDSFNGYGLTNTYNLNDVIVAENYDGLCGFCIVQSNNSNIISFFGPVGILQKYRKRGIGSLMFFKAVKYLKSIGKKKMGLWTSQKIFENFYKKLGFYKTFETIHIEWNI